MPGDADNACGTGGAACKRCQGVLKECVNHACRLDPEGRWQVVAVSAAVNTTNNTVDGDGSSPDVLMCLEAQGCPGLRGCCTSEASDTYVPYWNQVLATYTPAEIYAGLTIRVWDEDAFASDDLGGAQVTPNEGDIARGEGTYSFPGEDVASITLGFDPT